ncbi:MAG TPA: hypothetical protein VKG25_22690 [Bryobacteraceae bacterium]|nr:hypothetical protein [Bryobacteraceae bacterium]
MRIRSLTVAVRKWLRAVLWVMAEVAHAVRAHWNWLRAVLWLMAEVAYAGASASAP